MEASWRYVRDLAVRSEEIGFDITLLAELNLNDIKGVDEPSLDAWTTSSTSRSRTIRSRIAACEPASSAPPETISERLDELERVGIDLTLLQFSPQAEETERFAENVIQKPIAGRSRELVLPAAACSARP